MQIELSFRRGSILGANTGHFSVQINNLSVKRTRLRDLRHNGCHNSTERSLCKLEMSNPRELMVVDLLVGLMLCKSSWAFPVPIVPND